MSQPIGLNFKSRIPQFSDDASIEEALRVYHYGVDNYSTQPIPDDSIEGNFRSLTDRIAANETAISALGTTYVEQVSASATPNVITPQTSTTVPLTVRGASLQSENLQEWQNNSQTNLAVVFSDGSSSFNGYLSVGDNTKSSTTALNVKISNSSHKGVTIRSAASQSGNLQEWQNSSGNALARVESDGDIYTSGKMYSNNIEVVNVSDTQSLTNKSITIPSGETLDDFKARNIRISSSTPSGGNNGDIWLYYQ